MSSGTRMVELEITSGHAWHKRRLVDGNVFLIGTSPECDLVLAADGLSEICAIVMARSDAVTIRAIGEKPQLEVNGQTVAQFRLNDGDELRIGPFGFRISIRLPPPDVRARHAVTALRWTDCGEAVDMAAMSAAARLRADIRVAMAKEPRTLRRPA